MIGQEMDKKKQVLGRGLSSLIPAARTTQPAPPVAAPAPIAPTGEAIHQVPVGDIEPNPYQTRIQVDEQGLNELADSIKVQGILQPIILRQMPAGKLQLVAGQRRWLASQRAGKATVPAIVRQLSDEQVIELTIIENLQREDLNPLDQAAAFEKLASTCGLTQEQIAQRTGKDRATVANYMRLLRLPEEVRNSVRSGDLTMGHARALMALDLAVEQIAAAKKVLNLSMSVRQTEALVANWGKPHEKQEKPERPVDPNVKEAQRELERSLGCRVTIDDKKGRGKVVIQYKTLEDFDRIVEMLSQRT
ncbi:MAG TPA: ParB/RepB/Spo0J family partition protein [Terriglobales bacterium]|nr:ParB/RepB/Spo0J family partition protein [Terriglobales bacterium]